jgi:hypothetical protein
MTGLFIVKTLLVAAVVLTFLLTVGTISYRTTDTTLDVRIIGRVIRRVRLADIEDVHRRGAFVHENWSSLKFWNSVTVRRRSGLFRNFVISPDDPDAFAVRLQEAAGRAAAPASTPPGSACGW